MAQTLKKTPAAQTALSAQFVWGYTTGGADGTSDAMLNINGVLTSFNVATASTPTFDVMTLPAGATVIGGGVYTEIAITSTATGVAVGDDSSASRYLSNTSIKPAARVALVPTGFKLDQSRPIRLTFTNTAADQTLGRCRLDVQFTLADRATDNLKTT
jgi:hypothetical protein